MTAKSSPAHGLGDHVLHDRDAAQADAPHSETLGKSAFFEAGYAVGNLAPRGIPAEQPADLDLYRAAIREWGSEPQMRVAQEECCELGAAINQFLRGRITVDVLAAEVADVEIMCAQLRCMIGAEAVDTAKRAKIERLAARIGGGL